MELNEKLKLLREEKGLTQEEAAQALFVSRTAISKWESGRGCPSIDSLKEIAKFYCVTIDELVSSEKVISIAENESREQLGRMKNVFIGITDILVLLMTILPLYPKPVDGYIYSVNLFEYTDVSLLNRAIYFSTFAVIIILGIVKLTMALTGYTEVQRKLTIFSVALSTVTILYLAMAREPYATASMFIFLMIKIFIICWKTGAGAVQQ